jgi:hypothetical protein
MGDFGAASIISGTYNTIHFIFQLSSVHEETHVVHEQLGRFEETARTLKDLSRDKRIQPHLEQSQKDKVNKLVFDAYKLIDTVAIPVERSRVEEKVNGTTCLWHRIVWVLRDKGTVALQQPLLVQYQADMNREISDLRAVLRDVLRRDGKRPEMRRQDSVQSIIAGAKSKCLSSHMLMLPDGS